MIAGLKNIIGREQRTISYSSPDDSLVKRVVINSLEIVSGRRKLEEAYEILQKLNPDDKLLWSKVLELLDIQLSLDEENLARVPRRGPIVFIANHPFGVADGIALGYTISRVRSEYYVVANEVLCREKMLGKFFLPIDFRNSKEAISTNIYTRKKTIDFLTQGGAIGIFPSGGVATSRSVFKRKAEDLEWKRFLIRIIHKTKATVIPMYFHGQNSGLFQIASHINQNLRLGLLLSELNRLSGKSIHIRIGQPIHFDQMKAFKKDDLLTYLRHQTFSLSDDLLK